MRLFIYCTLNSLTVTSCLLTKPAPSSSKIEQYDSYLAYWMYQQWTRDFRRCSSDCKEATSHLRNGTLFKWYETKAENIKISAEKMLSGVRDFGLHQLP